MYSSFQGFRGTRKSATGGHLYSLSLAPLTTYYYTITSGAVGVQGQFLTGTINVGQNFPDAPLYDTTGTNAHGLQYPYIADAAQGTVVNDPTTGIPVTRVPPIVRGMTGLSSFNRPAIDVAGTGHWTNLANCGSNNVTACTGTGAGATDYLFLPLPSITTDAVYVGGAHFAGWAPNWIMDDMVLDRKSTRLNSSHLVI